MKIGQLHKLEKEFMNNVGSGDYILTRTDVADIKTFMQLTIDNFVSLAYEVQELRLQLEKFTDSAKEFSRGGFETLEGMDNEEMAKNVNLE